ncbi:hypothetical protein Cgig2_018690 [Carnegiea gigantea]|uniref:Uncharacterized protein n=1 Tax=Carnegiea gigantea TaxID=171969 RepID=A0A9Q1GRH7_9CARY|nr:hypothetical protein Cgig2_018690 [Carnegiea gigantea]
MKWFRPPRTPQQPSLDGHLAPPCRPAALVLPLVALLLFLSSLLSSVATVYPFLSRPRLVDTISDDLNITSFKDLFSSFGEVLDAYIPNHVGQKICNCKLYVMWARFQKRMSATGRMGSDPTKRKPVCKWIPKVKNVPSQDLGSPYKQALLSNPNGNELEGQENANDAVDKDVHEGLSNNSKTITQHLDNA